MRFLRPELAWWFIPGLALLILVRWRSRRQYAASTTVRWLSADSSLRASVLRRLPLLFLFAAIVLTILAFMDPIVRFPESEVQSRNRDIVLVLDMSPSMQTPIGQDENAVVKKEGITRMDAVKEAMKQFVELRRGDRLGLILFSNHAYVVCPLTFDHEYLLNYIDLVNPHSIIGEGRTAIGDALLVSSRLLMTQASGTGTSQGNQIVVLFTDGESNIGSDPVEALYELHQDDIHVHIIGIDLSIPNAEVLGAKRVLNAVTKFGGRSFDASSPQAVADASREVDSIEKGLLIMKATAYDRPVYEWFALPALLCLLGAIVLYAIPFFIDQT